MITIRRSTEDDKEMIYDLLTSCFFTVDDREVNRHVIGVLPLYGRFLLAFNEEHKLIGLLGIVPPTNSRYNGYFLDWGCVLPEYRGQGIMGMLVMNFLANRVHGVKVWAECWRISSDKNSHANIHNTLTRLGFELIVPQMLKWPPRGVCERITLGCCKYAHDENNCCCYEDIYCYEY